MNRKIGENRSKQPPFWLPASTFYFLATAVAIGVFFMVWAILAESKEENPWITAGLISSVSMISAVVVREVILRSRRGSLNAKQRRLDHALLSAQVISKPDPDPNKLTLERNDALVGEIARKSEAALVLNRLPESHREVFELCEGYLQAATQALASIRVGSPRLGPITRGREMAERLHRHHMLQWAEIELRANTFAEAELDSVSERLAKARGALKILDRVLNHYPDERSIVESHAVVKEFILAARIKAACERSERAERRGDIDGAIESLFEAERLLLRSSADDSEDGMMPTVRAGIERLLAINAE